MPGAGHPDIRDALRADTGGVAERRLRVRASADADTIVAAASGEYRAYLAALASGTDGPDALNGEEPGRAAGQGARRGGPPTPGCCAAGGAHPSLAACSAAVVLVLGGLLRLLGVRGTLPGSLLAAGWTLALFAATSALLALAALFRTALRGPAIRRGPPGRSRRGWCGSRPCCTVACCPTCAAVCARTRPSAKRVRRVVRLTTHRAQMMNAEKAIITMDQTG
nr:hypothetical protein [Streptomyces sp. LBUM 1486]